MINSTLLNPFCVVFFLMTSIFSNALFAQVPSPLVKLQFNESSGTTVFNTGTAPATLSRSATTPAPSTNVPVGVGGSNSLDFATTPGNYFVQSAANVEALKNLSAFTLTGWINTRSSTAGSGGNRIISWINHGGDGVDLVYQSNGSLRLGVDGWPDISPAFSSPNKVTANASAPATNWVFFAVTYQSNGQVQFYFGNNATDAVLDVTRNYPGPGVTGSNIGKLAIGAFNDATRATSTYDRMFRGLIDDIQIHGSALNLENIVAVQRDATDSTPPTVPTDLVSTGKTSTTISLEWLASTDNVGVNQYDIYNGAQDIAATPSTNITVNNLIPGTTYSLTVRAVDAAGNSSGPSDTVTVTTLPIDDTTPPSAPTDLVTIDKTSTTITFEWLPATDNVGVTQYNVYYGIQFLAEVQSTMITLDSLTPGTTYGLNVRAVDAAGNESDQSNSLFVTTNGVSGEVLDPLVAFEFNETSGLSVNSTGTAVGSFVRSANVPASSTQAASGSIGSFDFRTTPGNYYVQSSAPVDALKNLNVFTLTGWLNCKSNVAGAGGNRIISWINNGGDGVDLVYQNDGSLRLGVDGWPDNSPAFSSANKVPANTVAPAANWVFFAVAYQSNGQVQFYFGNNTTDATLDVTKSYPGPGVTGGNIGKLAIGAFNDATRNASTYDRMFRGLIDNVKIYGSEMSLSQIISIQRNRPFDGIPPTAPQNLRVTAKTPTSVSLQWDGSYDNIEVTGSNIYQDDTLYLVSNTYSVITLTGLSPSTTYQFNVKARDASQNLSPASNTVTVTTDSSLNPLVYIKFAEATTVENNYGTLGGQFSGGIARSSNIPVSGSPYSTASEMTSGVPLDGLKNLGTFTITGWVNKTTTSGNNRIVGWQPNNGGQGAELMISANGALGLGVNLRPENDGTVSSANKITIDPNAPESNWVFFAVTHDASAASTKYYFGNSITDATLDVSRYQSNGPAGNDIGYMYIAPEGAGLLDEIRVFGSVLTLQDIINVQGTLPDTTPPTPPAGFNVTSVTATSVGLNWTTASTDNIGIVSYDVFNGPTLLKVHVPQTSLPESFNNVTLTGLTPGTPYTLTVKARDGKGNYSPASNAVVVNTSGKLPATPVIWLKLDEPNNSSSPTYNFGTAPVSFYRSFVPKAPSLPSSVTNVPVNVGGAYAADYGAVPKNAYIESDGQIDELRNLSAFTLTGWVNTASNVAGGGGNRIISWINNGGEGVDLVYQSNGSLRLGVDGWPDNSPAFSSPNKVTTDAAFSASNWVYFAVTYQSTGQVQFYFGSNAADATLDVTRTYSGPGVTGSAIGRLAIGMFNNATRNASTYDRMFRGLIDNIQIYNVALTAQEIVTIQRVNPVPGSPLARVAMSGPSKQAKTEATPDEGESALYQNYPNPFAASTQIEMYVSHAAKFAGVVVRDVSGRSLKTIEVPGRGKTSVTIEGDNMSPGMYFYSLIVDGKVVGTKRMALIK